MTHKNKLISTTPSIEEILEQLPYTETYSADVMITTTIKTALLLGALLTIGIFISGVSLYPTALMGGIKFSLLMGLVIFTAQIIQKKLCYPLITTIDAEGIHIQARNREKRTTTWQQILKISKITYMSKPLIEYKIAPQIDNPKLPERIYLQSTIYDDDTTLAIMEMLRHHFAKPTQNHES